MRAISPEEAKEVHNIWTAHHQMNDGGEFRFRLSSADGTRYIRTVRPADSGEWQEAHFHRSVCETYIVQQGWIAFVEEVGNDRNIRILSPGHIVTTRPGVRHNVYMPGGAVIHTVKHGIGVGEDKEPAPLLTTWCKSLESESAIHEMADKLRSRQIRSTSYNEDYRHFDTLIWQMPAWSTAVFIGAGAVLVEANTESLSKILPMFTNTSLTAGFLLVVSLFLLGLTQVLYRFRIHQAPMKIYSRTPPWTSASTYLQVFVTAQAFLVLYLALGSMGLPLPLATTICTLAFVPLVIYREWALRQLKITFITS